MSQEKFQPFDKLPSRFKKLEERKTQGTFRSLSSSDYVEHDFYSNDYLGISRKLKKEKASLSGGTGSRLISGNSSQAVTCENFLACFFETESALVFNSGYDANIGLFSCLGERNDTIIYDEYIHASIRDGIRLGITRSYSFKHNDLPDLESKLKSATGNVFIAVESLYSMDGDFAPLVEIALLAEKHGAFLIVDEAHSVGIFGNKGKGLIDQLNLASTIFARIITFSKAYGTQGAAVLGSTRLISYLVNFARSFIYTTALPPEQYTTIQKTIQGISEKDQNLLQKNINYFLAQNKQHQFISDPKSPIQVLLMKDFHELESPLQQLTKCGYGIKPILYPTVPKSKERIRFCIHSFNTIHEIDFLCKVLNDENPPMIDHNQA